MIIGQRNEGEKRQKILMKTLLLNKTSLFNYKGKIM